MIFSVFHDFITVKCEPLSLFPPIIVHCDQGTDVGDTCTFSCFSEFDRITGDSSITCQPDGTWSRFSTSCEISNDILMQHV